LKQKERKKVNWLKTKAEQFERKRRGIKKKRKKKKKNLKA